MPGFVGQDAFLGCSAARPVRAPDLFDVRALGSDSSFVTRFEFVEQELPGEEAVAALVARGLALDLQPRRAVNQHDASGGLVDILAAMSARSDERLQDVFLAESDGSHASGY